MKKKYKRITIILTAVIIFLGSSVSINAQENITIYNSTMGEVMRHFEPAAYSELPIEIKEYYDSIGAYKILGENADEVLPESRGVIWVPSAIVLTTVYKNRPSSAKITFGGNYSCTKGVKINGFAYVIESSNGNIVESGSVSKTKSTSASLRKTVSRKNTGKKYYCRAIGHYMDYDTGLTKTTMQTSGNFSQKGGLNLTNSGLGIMWGPVSIDENAILIVVLLALLIIGTLIYYKRKK